MLVKDWEGRKGGGGDEGWKVEGKRLGGWLGDGGREGGWEGGWEGYDGIKVYEN